MIVYKLVKLVEDRLVSAFVGGAAKIEYIPGEWVEAPAWLAEKGYHILAYEDRLDAKSWLSWLSQLNMSDYSDYELWEAEADGIIRDLPAMMNADRLENGEFIDTGFPFPFGSIMVRRLRLIRRIA